MSARVETTEPGLRADTRLQVALHIGFALCALAMVVLYAPSYFNLAEIWAETGTFQYAFLIFPICAVLVWARRAWLARVVARPRPLGLLLLIGLLAFWLAGAATQINLAQHIAIVLIWPALVYTFYGPRVMSVLAFALGYIIFAIPFGDFLVGPMQTVTAHLAVGALKLTGLPVIMDGHYIETPVSTWHVAQACSGIKFFIALTAFSVLYAHLFFTSRKRRVIFVIAGMIVPIIANGLRVYFTILIGEYIGMHYATGTDHLIFGWQFFGLVLFLVFLAGWPWHERPAAAPAPERGVAAAPRTRVLGVSGAALAIIVLPAVWFGLTGLLAERSLAAMHLPAMPAAVVGQQRLHLAADLDKPLNGTRIHQIARYGDPANPLRIDYLTVDRDRDITTFADRLFNPSSWAVKGRALDSAPGQNAPVFVVDHLVNLTTGEHRELLYAYRIGDHWTNSVEQVKAQQALARLTGRGVPIGLLVVTKRETDNVNRLAQAGASAGASIIQSSR